MSTKVTVVSTGHPATDHRIFEKEARTLAEAGYEVRLIALHPEAERRAGVDIVPLPERTGRLDRFARRPWRALRLIRRHGGELVHIHDAELLQICPVLMLRGRPAVVYDVHEDFANLMLHRDWIPRPLRALVRALVRRGEALLARSTDAVVAATESLGESFPRHRRIALYNLPTQEFVRRAGEGAEPPSSRPVDVLHVGVLSSERLAFLVDTLRILLARRPETRVRLIGLPAPQREQIRNEVESDAVETLGRIAHDEVPGLVRECRLGVNVHPFMHPHLRVALPVKVLEYMAAGCGVVTSRLPELHARLTPETLGHMSTVAEPDPTAYAAAIAGWLDDPERLDAAGEHLRRAARDLYSWDTQAPKLVALYDELLQARSDP